MKHLGDITLIKGNEAPVVDCIIGGSPCQDLSVAGKRAGLAGERSGLYMDQIRIIKEMRYADVQRGNTDVDVRPRYMVWENVPGAASLFDGIGGFPYIWEQLNGKGSCLWVSEIEEFPMAVTRKRFGEDN